MTSSSLRSPVRPPKPAGRRRVSSLHRRRARGFTLLELIIAMAVIFLFTAIVAPSFSSFVPSLRVDRAAADLMATARQARSEASLRGRIVRLQIDSAEKTFRLLVQGNPFDDPESFLPPPGTWSQPVGLPEHVEFESVEGGQDGGSDGARYFEFLPDGSADDGSVILANEKGKRRTVRIEGITGRVYIEDEQEEK